MTRPPKCTGLKTGAFQIPPLLHCGGQAGEVMPELINRPWASRRSREAGHDRVRSTRLRRPLRLPLYHSPTTTIMSLYPPRNVSWRVDCRLN